MSHSGIESILDSLSLLLLGCELLFQSGIVGLLIELILGLSDSAFGGLQFVFDIFDGLFSASVGVFELFHCIAGRTLSLIDKRLPLFF